MAAVFLGKGLYRAAAFFGVLLLAGIPGIVRAECDPAILEMADEDSGLPYRSFGNRCEGFYKARVSASDITVVGFTLGLFSFERKPNEVVTVSAPRHVGQDIRIRAGGIPIGTYYRMDADLYAGKALAWPVRDVILQTTDFSGKNIGVYGYTESRDHGKIFVPISAESGLSAQRADNQPRLTVRMSQDIRSFKWRMIQTGGGGTKQESEWHDVPIENGILRSGAPIVISFDESMERAMEVELAARRLNGAEWMKDLIPLDFGVRR